MNRNPLDVVDEEVMPPEQVVESGQREIAEVLVIDGVELAMVEQVLQVGRLDHGDAAGLHQDGDPLDEAVEVRHVGQHVVRMNDVGALSLGREPRGQILAEEFDDGGNAALFGFACDVGRRLDPQYRDGRLGVVLEQVAVIAGDLDHQALRPKLALADQAGDQRPRVPQHGIGERREIAVVGKQLRRRNGLCDLDKRARRTKREVEWIERLRPAELFPGQQRVGERGATQRQHQFQARGAAAAAAGES